MSRRLTMKFSVRQLTFAAVFAALNVILSSFSVPTPFGGHLYLTDIAVCLAGITLNPVLAVIAGAGGAALGDVFFYPAATLITLVTRTVQVIVISVFSNYISTKKEPAFSLIGCVLGVIIMATGYTLGSAFIYSTPEYAVYKIPFELLQAAVGVAIAMPLAYKFRLKKICLGLVEKDKTV